MQRGRHRKKSRLNILEKLIYGVGTIMIVGAIIFFLFCQFGGIIWN